MCNGTFSEPFIFGLWLDFKTEQTDYEKIKLHKGYCTLNSAQNDEDD